MATHGQATPMAKTGTHSASCDTWLYGVIHAKYPGKATILHVCAEGDEAIAPRRRHRALANETLGNPGLALLGQRAHVVDGDRPMVVPEKVAYEHLVPHSAHGALDDPSRALPHKNRRAQRRARRASPDATRTARPSRCAKASFDCVNTWAKLVKVRTRPNSTARAMSGMLR